MSARPLLVVTGLRAEARLLTGKNTVCASAPPAHLRSRVQAVLAGRRPCAVVSFGLCGGLEDGLRSGALVTAREVVAPDGGSWTADETLLAGLRARLGGLRPPAREARLVACEAPVLRAADKRALARTVGAVAVDTESHIAAALAADHGVPFAVLRAVCDEARHDLPPLALSAIDADGRLNPAAIARELAHRPGQLVRLPGTALATVRAMRTLRRVRMLCGPDLGLAGLGVGG